MWVTRGLSVLVGVSLCLALAVPGTRWFRAPSDPLRDSPPHRAEDESSRVAVPETPVPWPSAPPSEPEAPAPARVTETELRPRESLEAGLRRSGVPRSGAAAIIAALRPQLDMRRLQPGERLRVEWGPEGSPTGVIHWRSPIERYELRLEGQAWVARRVDTPVESRVVAVAGALEDSLFASIERLGGTAALTARFVSLFEWDFDFSADSLPGDRFRFLVEKRYASGEFIGYGDVLVAQYLSVARPLLTAVAFPDTGGQGEYFDAQGRSVRKMFLRSPLDFTRITSGYSHARRHPILGGLRPHLAVDYGAPTGTPVRAVADALVEAAGWNGGYGLSVVLRHARGYKTMYNHLSKIHVRVGQRVRQRDVIGRVGSTGLSTGPHLDYRVVKNGTFVNPLGEKFIPGSPVPPERRSAFQSHLDRLLARLRAAAPLGDLR